MKKLLGMTIAVVCVFALSTAGARDTKHMYSIKEAMNTEDAKAKLDGGIRFYFGKQRHPKVLKRHGEFMSNKKTNAFNKTDKRACEWVFLSALLSFQQRAQRDAFPNRIKFAPLRDAVQI